MGVGFDSSTYNTQAGLTIFCQLVPEHGLVVIAVPQTEITQIPKGLANLGHARLVQNSHYLWGHRLAVIRQEEYGALMNITSG